MTDTPTYESTAPYANDVIAAFDSTYAETIGKFFVNMSETANAGDPNTPNVVLNFGWNLGPGAGAVIAGLPALGLGFESHYAPGGGAEYNEFHLYWLDKNGDQRRPLSYRIDKNTGAAVGLFHGAGFNFFGSGNDAPVMLSFDAAQMRKNFTYDGSGSVTTGIMFSGQYNGANSVNYINVNAQGSAANPVLNFAGFGKVRFGLVDFGASDGWFSVQKQTSGGPQSVFQYGPDTSTFNFLFRQGLSAIFETAGGGGGRMLTLDYATGAVIPKLPTYADNATAKAASWPTGALYKTATGEVRVVV